MRVREIEAPTLITATNAADVTRILRPPTCADALAYVTFMAYTSAGDEYPIHVECSWVDYGASAIVTSAQRIPIAWNRAGVAQIDSFYFAGLDGRGEPLHVSQTDPQQWMDLGIFVAGTELPSGGRAVVRVQWGAFR